MKEPTMENKVTAIAFGAVITALSYATHQPVWLTVTIDWH
jgi:chemotaxis protein CheY-P-specific phosphatase CheC